MMPVISAPFTPEAAWDHAFADTPLSRLIYPQKIELARFSGCFHGHAIAQSALEVPHNMKLIEAVPNVSEGNNNNTIQALTSTFDDNRRVILLHIDSSVAAQRTVFTIIGEPTALREAMFLFIQKASELIDMRLHHGIHPRIGAVDVCPFVPWENTTMEECIELARKLGKRVGEELQLPVYLYAQAATKPERQLLSNIRRGGYEGLAEKLKRAEWAPDFGPAQFNPRFGALAIGARDLLIAFNINLATQDVAIAKAIAEKLRMPSVCQAIGWSVPEFGCAQVSTNLLDIDKMKLHEVFENCKSLAAQHRDKVTGSEVVGMVPERVLIETGVHYGASSDEEAIASAIERLNLNDVRPFVPEEKIIEWKLRGQDALRLDKRR